ncbi:DNA polymerase III subunit delta' C-terminal domain-containing protein [Fastidiosibacter lacustris]|uniref:DNA polymerase III subunit delta' C-terminal domain-containing protein n=1 Tax=Fastidiosibacter lacustris TaxID=2056695 RepID=UPI000E3570DA|nr:DNA polymerase III subunit delta' C-terminal domain-containing protein [Fastidiosibacter lacustris]
MVEVNISTYYQGFLDQIKQLEKNKSLAHAILLHNIDKLDLDGLLIDMCASLLNQQHITDLTAFPDIFYLKPDETQIKLEQVKSMLQGIYLSSYQSHAKVVIIAPIEALNTSAANALLKSLEEPPQNTYFVMTSNNLQWVIPTLRSRVQVFNIGLDFEQKCQYLMLKYQMKQNEALKALQMSQLQLAIIDRIKANKDFWNIRRELIKVLSRQLPVLAMTIDLNLQYQDALYWLTSFMIDAFYYKLKIDKVSFIDQIELLALFCNQHTHIEIYKYYQRLLKLKDYEGKHFNVNKQLAIEALLAELSSLAK